MKLARLIFFRLSLLLLLALAGCGGPNIPLTGVITDAYTGSPVPNAVVTVGSVSTTANAEGRYSLNGWDPELPAVASLSGYESQTIELKSKPELAQAQGQATLDFTIRPNTVSGNVINRYTGEPVVGAVVSASDVLSATTGDNGFYMIPGVPEQFTLSVAAADFDSNSVQLTKATTSTVELRPNVLTGVLTDKYTNKPIVGATITSGGASATTDENGHYTLRGIPEQAEVVVSATDYTSQTVDIPRGPALDVTLRPSYVTGSIISAETNEPISRAIVLAMPEPTWAYTGTGPFTGTAVALTESEADGSYKLENVPEGAQIQVMMPGYEKAFVPYVEGEFTSDIALKPFELRSIYITAATASNKESMIELFDLIDRTELNGFIVDVKLDIIYDVGRVGYISNVPAVQELETYADYLDMEWIAQEARRRGIYSIARMPIMRDDILAVANPAWAIKTADGGLWADHGDLHWLDPFHQEVWDYNMALTEEIASFGFDEVQYDYIRFPSDGDTDEMIFSEELDRAEDGSDKMYNTIGEGLRQTNEVTKRRGIFFSIDVFGYATWRDMWEIGQKLEVMGQHVDYVYPMVYPSHYSPGELGLDNVDAAPYEIVLDSLEKGAPRLEETRALMRPWLQAFNAVWLPNYANYDRSMIRKQIQAEQDAPLTNGWALWNAANAYDPEWLDPQ